MASVTAMESTSGKMGHVMKVNGETEKQMDMESQSMLMEKSMKGNG